MERNEREFFSFSPSLYIGSRARASIQEVGDIDIWSRGCFAVLCSLCPVQSLVPVILNLLSLFSLEDDAPTCPWAVAQHVPREQGECQGGPYADGAGKTWRVDLGGRGSQTTPPGCSPYLLPFSETHRRYCLVTPGQLLSLFKFLMCQ